MLSTRGRRAAFMSERTWGNLSWTISTVSFMSCSPSCSSCACELPASSLYVGEANVNEQME